MAGVREQLGHVASGDVTICVCMHSANAALIVQAVNSHDAMKEALKFYADPQTWQLDGAAPISTAPIRADRGDRARAAMRGVETGSAIEAPSAMSAMKECVEALRKARAYLDDMSDHPEPGDTIQMIDSALAKLEKANG